jgi:hypothetical protein
MPTTGQSRLTAARRTAAAIAISMLVAACVGSGGASTASGQGSATQSPGPASPAASGLGEGFYLRAWQTQALAPQYTFGWLPAVTIAGGEFIDGRVAIPMIFPGPVYVGLSQRPITAAGIAAIVTEATNDGLLGATSDFSGTGMPGSITAHIELVVRGVTYDLTGPLPTDATTTASAPGTAAAFMAFWNKLGGINEWLGTELGESSPYQPTSLAVMLTPPADTTSGITPSQAQWPLTGTLAAFGSAMGMAGYRCGVVSGTDLATLLPVVQRANALTNFVDSTGAKASLQTRVLVPDEPGPCS